MKRIVIIGPESTGKSTLCEQLAVHYHTSWCPEYAREYLLTNGNNYTYDDLLTIAQGQIASEEKHIAESKQAAIATHTPVDADHRSLLFIDTNLYVMKVWCEFVFGECHRWILDEIVRRPYDLYLLCNTDLPWQPDALREYPDLESRQKLYSIYKDILVNQGVPWVEISGTNEERLQQAIAAINQQYSSHPGPFPGYSSAP